MAREAAALRRIEDSHVVPLFAVGEEDGEPYSRRHPRRGTLAHLLDDGRLDEPVAAAILAPWRRHSRRPTRPAWCTAT